MALSRRNALSYLSSIAGGSFITQKLSTIEDHLVDIPDGQTILFQGDSITDAGRNRSHYYANQGGGMGSGYVKHAVTSLMGRHADKDLQFYNRGISGHRVFELANRWTDDCLYLQPDVLSILIGVNDFWHIIDFGYSGTVEIYERDYNLLLDRTLKELPDVKLIIGEPFVLYDGTAIKVDQWLGVFDKYQSAARRVAWIDAFYKLY